MAATTQENSNPTPLKRGKAGTENLELSQVTMRISGAETREQNILKY
jgi:hypothetical protein